MHSKLNLALFPENVQWSSQKLILSHLEIWTDLFKLQYSYVNKLRTLSLVFELLCHTFRTRVFMNYVQLHPRQCCNVCEEICN